MRSYEKRIKDNMRMQRNRAAKAAAGLETVTKPNEIPKKLKREMREKEKKDHE